MSDLSSGHKTLGYRATRTDPLESTKLVEDLDLWDWRRRISELYAEIRASEPTEGWRRWRAVRDELFRHHPQSPLPPRLRAEFNGVSYFDYDPSYRFLVACDPPHSAEPMRLSVGCKGEIELRPFALTRGLKPRLGKELTLYWVEGYGGGVFLPFRDGTSGVTTYSGGRYVLDTIKGADLGSGSDNRIVIDFNFAYNPSCSYSDQWVCPLASLENTCPLPLRVGERG
jgi:uncharacterized protein